MVNVLIYANQCWAFGLESAQRLWFAIEFLGTCVCVCVCVYVCVCVCVYEYVKTHVFSTTKETCIFLSCPIG